MIAGIPTNKLNIIFHVLGLCIVFLQTIFSFKWILHPAYIHLYTKLSHSVGYENDIYLQNSIIQTSSIFYFLFPHGLGYMLQIPLLSLLLFFSVLVFCSIVGHLFLKRIFKFSTSESWLFISISIFTMSIILHGPRGTIIPTDIINPTLFAHCFWLLFLFSLYSKKYHYSTFFVCLLLSLHLKTAWFPISILLVTIALDRTVSKKEKIITIMSLFSFCLLYLNLIGYNSTALEKENALSITEFILERNAEEDAFDLLPKSELFKYLICLLSFPFLFKNLSNQYSDQVRRITWIIYCFSILIFLTSISYTAYFYKFIPIPELILLSPVRSTQSFVLIFWIMIFALVFKTVNSSRLYSFVSISGFLVLGVIGYYTRFGIVNFYTLFIFSLIFLIGYKNMFSNNFKITSKDQINFVLLLSIFLICLWPAARATNIMYKNYTTSGMAIPINFDKDLVTTLNNLKNLDDFNLVVIVGEKENFRQDDHFNFIAKKSQYFGDGANFYLNFEKQQEHVRRKIIIDNLIDYFNNDDTILRGEVLSELMMGKINLLVPHSLEQKLPFFSVKTHEDSNYRLISSHIASL